MTIILNKIGDIKDFASSKKLVGYIGLAPSVRDTDKTIRHGHITKRGDKILKTTIVQATLIATARKMVEIIYRTLKYNLVYEDFNNGILAES